MLSLRDTITGLKQAGDVEGRLKADLVQTHEDLATSRAAQVSPFLTTKKAPAGLCAAKSSLSLGTCHCCKQTEDSEKQYNLVLVAKAIQHDSESRTADRIVA